MAKRQRRKRQERRRRHAQRDGVRLRHSMITGAALAAGATLGVAAGAQAATYYVGSDADPGTGATDCATYGNTDCTLRDAVDEANANTGVDEVVFTTNVTGAVTLGGTDILIDDPVRIFGRGADVDTVSGNDYSRIFDIDLTSTGADVGIYGLTLSDGDAYLGGAIYNNNADLSVINSVLTGNTAYEGGAIYEAGGSNYGRNLIVLYSTIEGNTAVYGGGVSGQYSAGRIGGSTLYGNTAYDVGGGVFNQSGGYGVTLFDSTISGNSSPYGAGITTFYGYSYNTILANNFGPGAADTFNYYLYGLASLIRNPGSTVYGPYNIAAGTDPQLGLLANNGGSTPTLKPAASSPAVDKGFSYAYDDQRGFDRIVDNPNVANVFGPPYGAADIGSVELTPTEGPQPAPPPATTPPAAPPTPTFNLKAAIRKCKKKFPKGPKRKKCIRKAKRRAQASSSSQPFRAEQARTARAVQRWRAQARARGPERHWGDRAWRFDRRP